MGNQDSIPDKFQELWKYILNRIRFQYHFIRNTGQIRDLKRDRTLRRRVGIYGKCAAQYRNPGKAGICAPLGTLR